MSKSRSGAPRRVAVGLLAGALSIAGIALAPTAGAVDDVATDRYAGVNRYSTAAAVAGQTDFAGATTAILATGETFPDALAASGLAGRNTPAPIILTMSNEYSSEAQDALAALGSLDDVLIVGGTAAISQDVEDAVVADGYTVTRVAGVDRYETAAAIAASIGAANVGQVDGLTTALIATGTVFADALAGGPLAASNTMPILLVQANEIPASTETALADLGIEQVAILGGTAAVSDDVETALETMTGNPAVRIAGVNRFGTAAAAGEFGVSEFGWAPDEVLLASGLNFPDALSGGPLGGLRQAPILLLASVPQETCDFLDLHSDTIGAIIALGGTAPVSEEDLQAAEACGETTDNDAATGGRTVTSVLGGPELQSASISGFDLEELALVVTFVFDEDIEDSVDPMDFWLMNADTRNVSEGDIFNDGDDVDVDGENVAVIFNLADYGVVDATLAGVEEGAVSDDDGNENPGQTVSFSGIGNAASLGLLSAEITDEDDGIAEYTFAAPTVTGASDANQYQLIDRDGTVYTANGLSGSGTSETTPEDDEPSTTVEVQFLCSGPGTPYADACDGKVAGDGADLSGATIRRAVASTNPVLIFLTAVDPEDERIQAVDISGSGNTDAPDLVSISTSDDNDELDDEQILFLFDEDLATSGVDPSLYSIIYSHCNPGDAGTLNAAIIALSGEAQDGQGYSDTITTGSTCAIQPVSVDLDDDISSRGVVATFSTDAIVNDFLVAGQVEDGAVLEENGAGTLENANDEAQYSLAEDLYDDGETTGPQLIGASAVTDTTTLGNFRQYEVTFTFDADLDDGFGLTDDFFFWYMDGDDVQREVLDSTECDYDGDNAVVCDIDDEDSLILDALVVSVAADAVTGADVFALDSDELAVQFGNPIASIGITAPEAP